MLKLYLSRRSELISRFRPSKLGELRKCLSPSDEDADELHFKKETPSVKNLAGVSMAPESNL